MKLKTRLTKKIVDGLKYEGDPSGGSQCITWDSLIRGFGVRCFVTGVKSFILWYQFQGQRRRLTLGQFGPLTCEQARDLAVGILSKVARGIDPEAEQRQERESATMAELFEAYLQGHAIPHKKTWQEDKRRIDQYLSGLSKKKAKEVTRQHCLKLLNEIGAEHPYESNRVRALLHTIFQFAIRTGFLPENHVNPVTHIKRFPEQKRDRFVSEMEMRPLLEAIQAEKNVYIRSCLLLYLLTGARREELLRAKWQDIDLHRAEWRIPETKGGRIHYVPLSTAAVSIFRQIPKVEGNEYVFPGKKAGTRLVNIKDPWGRVRKAAGLEDVRLHDLRRTTASWAAIGGGSLLAIGKLLGHRNAATTEIYARLSQSPVRDIAEGVGGKIVSFMAIQEQQKKAAE